MRVIIVLLLAALAACAPVPPKQGGDILAIGDSAMAWNRAGGNSIADAIGKTLDRPVMNLAVSGAVIGSAQPAAVGNLSIQRQYPGGQWNWIVVNGSANDLGLKCGCGACGPQVNALIGPDGRGGVIPGFVKRLRATGAKVLWMGYYTLPKGGFYKGCRDDVAVIESRIAAFAAREEGIFFADAEAVIDPNDLANFTRDKTHPSALGSARVGAYLAQVIARNSGSSQ